MKYLSFLLAVCFTCSMANLVAQDEEFGLASYYSDDFQGRDTAYGDTYDKNEMTCAHKRYAYGTRLRVTRLDNKQSVVVKVIDKGPFIKGRVIDLSRRAATQLGIIDMGDVRVKVERISNSNSTPKVESSTIIDKPAEEIEESQVSTPDPIEEKVVEVRKEPISKVEIKEEEEPALIVSRSERTELTKREPTVRESTSRSKIVGDDFTPYGLYEIVLKKPEQKGYGVQVASLSNFDNVLKKVASLQAKWFENILISMEAGTNGNNQYKVILGPFATQKEAMHYQASMKSRYSIDGFVINLEGLKY